MGFLPCKPEPYIYIRKYGELWKYVTVYVDILTFIVQYPAQILSDLNDTCTYELKGTSSIVLHLGYTFLQDDDTTLCMASWK